jgi:hypothetical protein
VQKYLSELSALLKAAELIAVKREISGKAENRTNKKTVDEIRK